MMVTLIQRWFKSMKYKFPLHKVTHEARFGTDNVDGKAMNIEHTFFYYERTRKQQAKVLLLNMLLLPMVLWLFLAVISASEPLDSDFSVYLKYILVVAEFVLLSVAAWFLRHPAKFYIKLTNSEFSSVHPSFKEWTFSVDPHEIIEVEHSTDIGANSSLIEVKMNDGGTFLLSSNYPYKRHELYQALQLVNPKIKTPKKTWIFPYKK